jgi:hypothetical protein
MVNHHLARHEAGHATVVAALGVPVLRIQISKEPVGVEMNHPTHADQAKRQDLDARFTDEALSPSDYSREGLDLIADEVAIYLGGLAGESTEPTKAAYAAMRAADDLAKVFRLIEKYTEHLPKDDRDEHVRSYFLERMAAAGNLIAKHPETHKALTRAIASGQDLEADLIEHLIGNAGEMPVPR